MNPVLVPIKNVDFYFPLMSGYLDKAIQHNRCTSWTIPELWMACRQGNVFMYVDDYQNPRNVMVVEFPIYANERVLYIALMGGEGGPDIDWDETMRNVHKIKELNGCERVISHLRGWLVQAFQN